MIRFSVWVYAALLKLIPGRFEEEFGQEAISVFERMVRDAAERGPLHMLRTILTGWSGVLLGVFEEAGEGFSAAVDRRGGGLSGLGLDLKRSLRSCLRRPVATATVVGTVGLAVGASTAAYSVVDGVLLRPLDYPDAHELMRIWQTRADWTNAPNAAMRALADRLNPHAPVYEDWRTLDTGFADLGAYIDAKFVLQGSDGAEALRGQEATSGFFRVLGVEPLLGRTLVERDDTEGAPPVVVLSEGLWRDRFSGDRDALGASLVIGGRPHDVVGVMPAGFAGPGDPFLDPLLPGGAPRLWTPLTDEARRGWKNVAVLGRTAAGVSPALAHERLVAAHAALTAAGADAGADARPVDRPLRGVRAVPLLESIVGDVRTTLWFLMGAVALVWAVAIVNLSNLLIGLGLERRQEVAVRSALGAGSARLLRGLLVDSGILAVAGGAVGTVAALLSIPVLVRLLPSTLPRQDAIGVSPGVLFWGIAVTGLTAVVVGVIPALLGARTPPQAALRQAPRGGSASLATGRVRSALVVSQVALAFALSLGAGLLAHSYFRLMSVERGFDTEGLVSLWVEPAADDHPSWVEYDQFITAIGEGLNAIPGVDAAPVNAMPLSGMSSMSRIEIERPGDRSDEVHALIAVAGPGYLPLLGIPVVQGRSFHAADDRESVPVALVNRTLAERHWPGHSAVGRSVYVDGSGPIEVVGVTADFRHEGLDKDVEATVFLSGRQSTRVTNEWILKLDGGVTDLATALREARGVVASVSPRTPVARVLVLDDAIARSVALPRFRTLFILGLAGVAALLALLGVYGVLAFSVSLRMREIGIRMALGAAGGTIVRSVLASGIGLFGVGLVLGLFLAWFAAGLIGGFLFEVSPLDFPTYLTVATALMVVGCFAAYLPARRAAAVDPLQVLTAE